MRSPVSRTKKDAKPAVTAPEPKKPVIFKHIPLKPRVSEKGYALSERYNTYIFDVPVSVNKFDIALAVATQYEVSVTGVRLAGVPGKAVTSYRNRGRRSLSSTRSGIRKAYVTLKEGDKLPIFDAVETDEAPKEAK